ncbi:MAG: hypothetical protein ACT4P1_18160 [Sporichthyaceae bacterium]
MRNTVILGLVAGALFGVGIVGVNAASDDGPMPPGKRAAVEAAVPDTEPLPQGPDLTLKQTQADVGPAADVAQVKAAVAQMLSAEIDAYAAPDNSLPTRAATAAQRRAKVAQDTERTWAPKSLATKRTEALEAFDQLNLDPTYRTYRKARYVIIEWQGVTVTGDTATATLLGHADFLNPSGWTSGRREQLQLELVRTGNGVNGWQFLTKGIVFDESAGH